MKVLLIGTSGFIGQHAFKLFSQWGYDVLQADISSNDPSCIILDKLKPDFKNIFENNKIDVCINCSGAASVPDSILNPSNDFYLNTVRVQEILDAIRNYSLKTKFIHLSSAAVYGNPTTFPILETSGTSPLSPYGWHKLIAEKICSEYTSIFGIETISLRIFSAYGPGLCKQIFWDTYKKSLGSYQIEFFGTGNETRDFIYVEDVVACFDLIIKSGIFDGRVVNIANSIPVKIHDAVSLMLKVLNLNNEIIFTGSTRVGDPLNWEADISYLKQIGYKPMFSLKNGLERVAEWIIKL
jgi:dTDP-glucose 4,6-dehydratase/UDP-glucose 4-epimerase